MASKNSEIVETSIVDSSEEKKQMDAANLVLLRLRIAELEADRTTDQTKRTTLTEKDISRDRFLSRKLVQAAMNEGYIGSKALPAQYEHKADTTHDITAAAVRHHTGSHYHMAGSVQFQRG